MSFKESVKLSLIFIKGLKEYNLTNEEIIAEGWKYCGGNEGRHLNYFRIACPGEVLPDQADECVCGHNIVENCYITDGDRILILGNCCIKRFIPDSGRTCERCGEPHRNRKDNLCSDCRPRCAGCDEVREGLRRGICRDCWPYLRHSLSPRKCAECGGECKAGYTTCWPCFSARSEPAGPQKCADCGVECKPQYERCWDCCRARGPTPILLNSGD